MGKQVVEDLNAAIHRGDVAAVRSLVGGLTACVSSSSSSSDVGGLQAAADALCVPGASGMAPLHLAARLGRRQILEVLLETEGVDIDALDSMQWTPLHHAASHRGVLGASCSTSLCNTVGDLVRRRADPCVASADGVTALDLARRAGCLCCVRALESEVVLWQGWVEHFELRMFLLPSWNRRWLVLHRDRRQNTGPSFIARGKLHNTLKELGSLVTASGDDACPKCAKSVVVPDLVRTFPCPSCGELLAPPTAAQLALYEPAASCAGGAEGSVAAKPTAVLPLPSKEGSVEASAISRDESAADALLEGRIGAALHRAVSGSSAQMHGVQLKILGAARGGIVEHMFRVKSISEQQGLLKALLQATSSAASLSLASCAFPSSAGLQPTAPPAWQALVDSGSGSAAALDRWECGWDTSPGEDLPPLAGLAASALASQQALREAPSAALLVSGSASTGSGDAVDDHVVASAPPPPPPPLPPPPLLKTVSVESPGGGECAGGKTDETGLCAVCMEIEADTACVPCGHLCGCYRCLSACLAGAPSSGQALCPMCRGPVTSVVRIYRS